MNDRSSMCFYSLKSRSIVLMPGGVQRAAGEGVQRPPALVMQPTYAVWRASRGHAGCKYAASNYPSGVSPLAGDQCHCIPAPPRSPPLLAVKYRRAPTQHIPTRSTSGLSKVHFPGRCHGRSTLKMTFGSTGVAKQVSLLPFLKGLWPTVCASLQASSSLGPEAPSKGLAGPPDCMRHPVILVEETLCRAHLPVSTRSCFMQQSQTNQREAQYLLRSPCLHSKAPASFLPVHPGQPSCCMQRPSLQESQTIVRWSWAARGLRADLCRTVLMGTRKLSSL